MKGFANFHRFFTKALKQPFYAINVLRKRLTAGLYYKYVSGVSPYPEAITLFLTHRCNLRCKMCGQWGEGGVTKKADLSGEKDLIKQELPLDRLALLVDEASGFMPSFTLFGGEPLLHPGCIDLIRYIKSRKMHCLIITNGSLLKERADEIVESGLDELNVSLDGGAQLHDSIRGMAGLHDRIMSGLKKISELKSMRSGSKPLVNLQCTITKYNCDRLEEMIDVAKEARANSLTYHNLIFTNNQLLEEQKRYDQILEASSKEWEGFNFDPGLDPDKLYSKMERILSERYPFSVDFYPNFTCNELKRYYKEERFMPSQYKSRCMSPWLVAYIFPDGEVRPCLNSTYSYGNIKDEPFKNVWNSENAIKFRRILKKNRIFPLCVRCTELYRY